MTNIACGIDWQDAFSNAAYIPDGDSYPEIWAARAKAFRDRQTGAMLDTAYGEAEREKLDIFGPGTSPDGLVVLVHGGYWMSFGKSDWSHLAAGALERNWAVAIPGYTLAPDVGISEITGQIASAIQTAAEQIDGPIRLVGHSAGGHLVARMICENSPLPPHISEHIRHTVAISGLYDLRPLRLNAMNETLGLTPESAIAESPALLSPHPGARLTAWVGENERPEFLRQSALIVEKWRPKGAEVKHDVAPGVHHFNVIAALEDPGSLLVRELFGGS